MKYWKAILLAAFVILTLTPTPSQPQSTESPLVRNAQNIDDLRYVLGPNYKLFVAAYWRFMVSSCTALAAKLLDDMTNGRLQKYCGFLTRCPSKYETQSCLISISAYSTFLTCCPVTEYNAQITQNPVSLTVSTLLPATRTPELISGQETCNYRRVFPSGRIFGGEETQQGEFPWMAMLLKNGTFLCGCVVLDSTHVMTTAHCFDIHTRYDRYEVIAGKHTASLDVQDPTEQRVSVTSFIKHDEYDREKSWNDIAVLELRSPFFFNDFVLPACLPASTDVLEPFCTVAGWGKIDGYKNPEALMKVELQAYNRTQCHDQFRQAVNIDKYLHDGAICAANGQIGQKDACKGDSGGPLMCKLRTQTTFAWFVFGMVSHGNECAKPNEPGFYVNVQHYIDWINETIHSFS